MVLMSTAAPPMPHAEDQLDRVFSALSDRTRRALLQRLAAGPAVISELARPFDMSLPAVSKHLRVLESAGLVSRRKDGRVHRCTLSAEPLRDVAGWVSYYEAFWDGTLASLANHLENGA